MMMFDGIMKVTHSGGVLLNAGVASRNGHYHCFATAACSGETGEAVSAFMHALDAACFELF